MSIFSIVLMFLKKLPPKVWVTLAILTMVSLLWLYVESLKKDILDRDVIIDDLNVELGITASEKSALQIALVNQNSSIDTLAKAGKKLQEELDELRRSQTASINYGATQESLRTANIPSDCLAAMSWHSQYMRQFEQKYSGATK